MAIMASRRTTTTNQRWFGLFTVALVLLATITTWTSTFDCTFYRTVWTSSGTPAAGGAEIQQQEQGVVDANRTLWNVGLWSVQQQRPHHQHYGTNATSVTGTTKDSPCACVSWSDNVSPWGDGSTQSGGGSTTAIGIIMDWPLQMARAVSLIASILSLLLTIALVLSTVWSGAATTFSQRAHKLFMASSLGLGVMTLLYMFLAVSSRVCRDAESCQFQRAGKMSMVSAVLWFFCSCWFYSHQHDSDELYYHSYRPKEERHAPAVREQQQQQQQQEDHHFESVVVPDEESSITTYRHSVVTLQSNESDSNSTFLPMMAPRRKKYTKCRGSSGSISKPVRKASSPSSSPSSLLVTLPAIVADTTAAVKPNKDLEHEDTILPFHAARRGKADQDNDDRHDEALVVEHGTLQREEEGRADADDSIL